MATLELEPLQILTLLGAGAAAGFINTLAGGGSLLTIPALLFAGIPSTIANATNRVAVVMQCTVATAQFRRRNVFELRESLPMLLPAFAGSIIGAFIAAEIDPAVVDIALAIVLVLMLATLFFRPADIAASVSRRAPAPWLIIPVFFIIGLYGGFVQAGVGFLLILGINLLFGFDLVKTNALKVLIVALYSLFALSIFAMYGQVMWLHGVTLGVGNVAGALVGVRLAVKRGAAAVRWVIVAAVVLTVLKLFGAIG